MTVSNIVQTVSLIAGEAVPLYRFVQLQTDGKIDLADDAFTARVAGTPQVDTLTANATTATDGTFSFIINGHSAEFNHDDSAATIQTALRALLLNHYGAAAVAVVATTTNLGTNNGVITLTFVETMGLVNIVIDMTEITGNAHALAQTTLGVDPVALVPGGPINGVSASASAADLDAISVSLPLGINKVEAGASLSVGDQITTDSTGRAVTHVSGAGGWIAGFALDAASGAGEIIRVLTQVTQDGVT